MGMCQCSKNPTWVIVGSNKASTVQAQCQGKEVVFSKDIQEPRVAWVGCEKAVWPEKRQRGGERLDWTGPLGLFT